VANRFWVELFVSVVVLIVASIFDIKTRRIPNWLNFSAMLVSIGLSLWGVFGDEGSAQYLVRFLLFISIFFFGSLRLMGMGDIKLLMALALLNTPLQLLLAIACGAVMLVGFSLLRNGRKTIERVRYSLITVSERQIPKPVEDELIPFAPYLTAGYILISLIGGIMIW